MNKRILSNSTELSIGTTIDSNLSVPTDPETYESILKVILFEYKNEARFKFEVSIPIENKRHSWFNNNEISKEFILNLKNYLSDVALGKNDFNPFKKRCLLHLYNDLLIKNFKIERIEDLILDFISVTNKEIQIYKDLNDKIDLFDEINSFLLILVNILKSCKNSDSLIKKINDYKKNSIDNNLVKIEPTFKIDEISNAKLIGKLFNINDSMLQNDVLKFKTFANDSCLNSDSLLYRNLLTKNEFQINPDSFDSYDDYFNWKNNELIEVDNLLKNLDSHSPSHNSNDFKFIPKDPSSVLTDFLIRILNFEADSDFLISNNFKAILKSCCKYWRIDEISQSCLLFKAAHLSILKNEHNYLNVEKTNLLFGILSSLIKSSNLKIWSKFNKKLWITNLSNTYIQIMSSLKLSLSSIFIENIKLTPILKIFYEFIEPDQFYSIILKSNLPKKWLKRLKNSILETTEKKYVDILKKIPRDNTLNLIHVKEISETLSDLINKLFKKFQKPLLDEIWISNECGYLFIKLFCEDLKNILNHIEHYALKINKSLNLSDSIETYKELANLRTIFNNKININENFNSKFDFNLENFFFKYINSLCDESIRKIFPVVKKSFEQDDFKPIDLENKINYSNSVLDIFKMINEIFNLFKNLNWENEFQLSFIYTKLMKSVSNSIIYYCSKINLKIIKDLKDPDNLSIEKKSLWSFNEMKDSLMNGNNKFNIPEPYSFKVETCVALNNLSQMLKQLKTLEVQLNPERIKKLNDQFNNKPTQSSNNVFTINILRAENIKPCGNDGLSSSYVVLMDPLKKREIGKTKTIPQTLNPVYEEEFEFESTGTTTLTATIWNHGTKLSNSHELIGRTILQLDPKNFRNDGIYEEIIRDFDLQGKLIFQISLESEKDDIIFSIGKAYRSVKRTMERIYSLIVEKFSVFITFSFSRQTLKSICSNNGFKIPNSDEIEDSIIPLFDYLNANLQILANTLDNEILLKVMLESWKIILNSADNLLLPALASVKVLNFLSDNSNWKTSLTTVVANMTNSINIPGYGRSLTPIEMDCIFVWLNSLSLFFHNEGSGPSLEDLKNEHYERLLLIKKFYKQTPNSLKLEVNKLIPLVLKAMKTRNFLGEESTNDKDIHRKNTIARSNTVLAYGTSERRQEFEKLSKESKNLIGDIQINTEDIILRILLTKDEKEFVSRRLSEREKISRSLATERLARLAVRGKKKLMINDECI